MKTKYYAMITNNDPEIVYLGEFKTFDEASDKTDAICPEGMTWIFQ